MGKEKFVISTNYVITLDNFVGIHKQRVYGRSNKIHSENKDQINEWNKLFGDEIFKDWKNIKVSDLSSDMYSFKKNFRVDTKHISEDFKWKMLIEISKRKILRKS